MLSTALKTLATASNIDRSSTATAAAVTCL